MKNTNRFSSAKKRDSPGPPAQPPAEEPVDHRPGQRQRRHQPDQVEHARRVSQSEGRAHHFRRLASSTFAVFRRLNIATMIARPTTTSAAATTIEKNART